MKTSIEFYIPINKIDAFLKGGKVAYSCEPANGLIKIVTDPNSIVFVEKITNIYYIRKSTWKERQSLKKRRKLK